MSGGADNVKQWRFPDGMFLQNLEGLNNTIVNTLAVNNDGVLFGGGGDGTICAWDYKTGYNFQQFSSPVQSVCCG